MSNSRGGGGDSGGGRGGYRGDTPSDDDSNDGANDGGGVRGGGGWPQQAAPGGGLRGGGFEEQVSSQQGFAPPNQGFVSSDQGFVSSNQGFVPPNQGFVSSDQGLVSSNQGFVPPNQGFAPPNQGFSGPNQGFAPYDPSRDRVRGGGTMRGQWRAVGGDGEWRGTHAATGWKGRIYASHSNGKVFAIDPDSGQWQQVGASSGWSTRLMFGMGEYLVLVERSGTAWALDPVRGGHLQVGKDGEWANIDAADATDQHVYCHSTQGGLWQFTPPAHWQQLGTSNGWRSKFVFAGGGVTTFEQDHSLYRVDPSTGQHVALGRTSNEVRAGVGVHGHVYANFDDGGIWDLDLQTGQWSAVGDARTWQSQALIATGGRLFTLESRGSFFEVYV